MQIHLSIQNLWYVLVFQNGGWQPSWNSRWRHFGFWHNDSPWCYEDPVKISDRSVNPFRRYGIFNVPNADDLDSRSSDTEAEWSIELVTYEFLFVPHSNPISNYMSAYHRLVVIDVRRFSTQWPRIRPSISGFKVNQGQRSRCIWTIWDWFPISPT